MEQSNDYKRRHLMVNRKRGPAKLRDCRCGNTAIEWATIHGADGEHPLHYFATCRSCHRGYDAITPETRSLMSAAQLGRKHSPETRAKMSASHHGISADQRARMVTGQRERLTDPEYRAAYAARLGDGNKGRKFTPEHRANLSASMRAALASKRLEAS